MTLQEKTIQPPTAYCSSQLKQGTYLIQLNPVSGKPCYTRSNFITKPACTAQILLQLTAGCCNTFDELLLEDQIQYDHRDTCKQRCCHQLRIIVGVLSLHFCKCC